MLPIIYFLKYLVRSGIRTHAYSCRLERSALDHCANNHIECRILILLSATTACCLKYLVRSGIRTHAYCDLNAAP